MRILVTGARTVTPASGALVWQTLDLCLPYAPLTVVHGMCPAGGVDWYADAWALQQAGAGPERHPADWVAFGRAAGMVRNSRMVELGADVCLGFPGPGSRGTWDCLCKAAKAGIPTFVVASRGVPAVRIGGAPC